MSSTLQRLAALILAVVVVPAVMVISSILQDAPIRVGDVSPRTVVAPDLVRVDDEEATEVARAAAAEAVAPVLVHDADAVATIVPRIRDAFEAARSLRTAPDGQRPLTVDEQVAALESRLPMLDDAGRRLLVGLSDSALAEIESEAVEIAQIFARTSVREERLDEAADRLLEIEFRLRPLSDDIADRVVAPIVRDALVPTVTVDEEATAAARAEAAAQVAPVQRTYTRGSVIVSAGEVVRPVQMAALEARGLDGADPWRTLLEVAVLAVVLSAILALYLRTYRRRVWRSGSTLLLLAGLLTLSALAVQLVVLLPAHLRPAWSFILPLVAVTMLATILVDPAVGVLFTIPHVVLTGYALPAEPAVMVFAALTSLAGVPLVTRLSARGDLRRAAARATVGSALLATAVALAFLELDVLPTAAAAGLLGGMLAAVVVVGGLPFLESWFGVATATGLLDLADRNHPLLRALERDALGTYNHSILVSTMVDRAARAIGADALLASVQALYHDIGKLERPYFFVENQFGIPNPHDELDPMTSADIIRQHVADGVAMARMHRLPEAVVHGIASHHGTTVVAYFHSKALAQATDPDEVDKDAFRYPGPRPATREAAVLMLADCCESAARAAAQADRNLSRSDLSRIVADLLANRVEDGQLDDSALTFRDLRVVQESFVSTLVGVYHPRITYPAAAGGQAAEPVTKRSGVGAQPLRQISARRT